MENIGYFDKLELGNAGQKDKNLSLGGRVKLYV